MTEVELRIGDMLDAYPKAYQIVHNYFVNMMIETFKETEVPEEYKEAMRKEGLTKERLSIIIGSVPRCLFDVFDENEIYIEIYRTQGSSFTFEIQGFNGDPGFFLKRKDCEIASIREAFKLLEVRS